jgi:hypothetical protein
MSNLLDVVERVAEAFYKQQVKVANNSSQQQQQQQQQSNRTAASSNDNERHSNTASTAMTDDDTSMMQNCNYRIPKSIVRAASEQYRILATRVPVGSISNGIVDSAERRAAALLEYCARRMPAAISNNSGSAATAATQPLPLSWSLLGAAIHVTKTSTLSQLQHQLVHFMTQTSTTTATTKTSISSHQRSTSSSSNRAGEKRQSLRTRPMVQYKQGVTAQSTNETTVAAPEPHLLPTLALRLSGYLLDPHRVLLQARQLWCDLHSYYDHASSGTVAPAADANERRGHLYDLQRYAAAYQAAILYHVAVTTNSNSTVGGASGTTVRPVQSKAKPATKRKFSKWNDEALHPDDVSGRTTTANHHDNGSEQASETSASATTMERHLQLTDLVEASSEFTYLELKQVLPRVQELAVAIKKRSHDRGGQSLNRANKEAASLRQSRGATQLPVSAAASRSQSAAAPFTTNPSDKSNDRTASSDPQRFGDGHGRSNRDGDVDSSRTLVSPSLSFYDLKKELLTSARNQARQSDATPMTDDKAIACAADAILRKHGILV